MLEADGFNLVGTIALQNVLACSAIRGNLLFSLAPLCAFGWTGCIMVNQKYI